MLNLRSYDLNLMVIFRAIMMQQSVVGAAKQVGLSPSAVSHALARLRVMLNDELFTKTGDGLKPSKRALDLYEEIDCGLSHLSNAIELQQEFDPSKADRVFTMQIADYISGFLLPTLAHKLALEAPGVSVHILPFSLGHDGAEDHADLKLRFGLGDIDPGFDRSQRLLTDTFIVLMRRNHPMADREMTAELYASLSHVKLSQSATGTTLIDDALASRGLARHIAMTVPSWFDMPQIIEKTDMIAIVPRHWISADARIQHLQSAPLPLEEVTFSIYLSWDVRRERDPGQKWFRKLVAGLFASDRP